MDFGFKLLKKDNKTRARLGVITTPSGIIKTPAFSPVGTKASVKGLTPDEIKSTGSQVVLGNAYHLYLKPGLDNIAAYNGFAPFMGWDGPTVTDSGGYQVSFIFDKNKDLGIGNKLRKSKTKITDEGMSFSSHIDGSPHFLTPKLSMEIQRVLAADIIMALDQPMSTRFSDKKNKEALTRTLKWEEDSFKYWQANKRQSIQGKYQALFGIVQGGLDKKVRRQFLKFVVDTGFSGIAIGDETIGSDPQVTAKSLDTVADLLPDDKPVHALGLGGGPEGVFAAVDRGVDMFDNSSVTRLARTGLVFIYPQDGGVRKNKYRLNIKSSKHAGIKKPISKSCSCYTCQHFTLGYLQHLFTVSEMLGPRLATIHNIYFYNKLMAEIRSSLKDGNYSDIKKHWKIKV